MVTTKEYTFTNVTANHIFKGEFTRMTHTVNIAVHNTDATGCKIKYAISDTSASPSTGWEIISAPSVSGTNITVESGKYLHFEAYDIPTGKSFWKWELSYQDQGSTETENDNPDYTVVAEDIDIVLYLNTIPTHSISVTTTAGGTISYVTSTGSGTVPANTTRPITVLEGDSITFTVNADTNYEISRILVDGSPITL